MAFVENTPNLGSEAQRMGQGLKNHKAPSWAIAVPTQGGERKSMRGIVSKVKLAIRRECLITGIDQSSSPGIKQSTKLVLIAGLGF